MAKDNRKINDWVWLVFALLLLATNVAWFMAIRTMQIAYDDSITALTLNDIRTDDLARCYEENTHPCRFPNYFKSIQELQN